MRWAGPWTRVQIDKGKLAVASVCQSPLPRERTPPEYLLGMLKLLRPLELIDRHHRMVDRNSQRILPWGLRRRCRWSPPSSPQPVAYPKSGWWPAPPRSPGAVHHRRTLAGSPPQANADRGRAWTHSDFLSARPSNKALELPSNFTEPSAWWTGGSPSGPLPNVIVVGSRQQRPWGDVLVSRRARPVATPACQRGLSVGFTTAAALVHELGSRFLGRGVLELARCEYIERCHNVIVVGNSGTGKTHIALGLGLAACQRGLSVGFTTAAALVHELIEARDERRLLNLQRRLARVKLLIIDELGFVPLSKAGAELLFEVFSQRYERGSVLVTSNLPFDEWTEVFGSERLTGALLDRLTHHVDILEMNGDSYRLKHSRKSNQPRANLALTPPGP